MREMDKDTPPPGITTLAERLKWARERKQWSQPHLATAAEVSTSTVGMVESGARQNKGSLPQLAQALGVRHRWLFHGELPVFETGGESQGVKAIRPTVAQPMSPGVEQRLTRLLAVLFQIPDDQRDAALRAATEVLLDHLPPPPR